MATKRRFLSRCETSAVRGGPNNVTVKANNVTSKPAVEVEIDRSVATPGRRPTMTNSVVTMTKADMVRSGTEKGVEAGRVPSTMPEMPDVT